MLVLGIVALVAGIAYRSTSSSGLPTLQPRLTVTDLFSGDAGGYARAVHPREFVFPEDHGPHPEYRTEWWYFSGNLKTGGGRRFGFQLTFFRFSLTPKKAPRASKWAAAQIYMGHLAVTDIDTGRFFAFERLSREALGLAGARATPPRVWLEDWAFEANGDQGSENGFSLIAQEEGAGVELDLRSLKPVVLQGDGGLSRKSAARGNASYYYSYPRLKATGKIMMDGQDYPVEGLAWMDREWGTSALGADQEGWDWFALQLDDGHDLMYYQLRKKDGRADRFSAGTLVKPDGSVLVLGRDDVELSVSSHWLSTHSGARYPGGWRLRVPGQGLDLEIHPHLADQELDLSVRYWEGAVRVAGKKAGRKLAGNGYVELAGYAVTE